MSDRHNAIRNKQTPERLAFLAFFVTMDIINNFIMDDAMETKRCSACKVEKPISEFVGRKKPIVNNCLRCRERSEKWAEENPEKRQVTWTKRNNKYAAAGYYKQPHLKAQQANYHKQWYKENAERLGILRRQWESENRDARNAITNRWRTNCEGNGGSYTPSQWQTLVGLQKGLCLCCGELPTSGSLHVDHVVPVSKGGTSDILNIQGLCQSCNSSKGANLTDFRPPWLLEELIRLFGDSVDVGRREFGVGLDSAKMEILS